MICYRYLFSCKMDDCIIRFADHKEANHNNGCYDKYQY